MPHEALLLLDDVDLLPAQSRSEVLEYLLANAPSNLLIALSSRPSSSVTTAGVLGSAPMIRITARELRFREDETAKVVHHISEGERSTDVAVRVHGLTDGWPLGVRLAIASQLRNAAPFDFEMAASADISQYFLYRVINRQPEETRRMLVGMAHFDPIHADLCRRALGPTAPVSELDRLADESLILTRSEDGEWLPRLNQIPLAKF